MFGSLITGQKIAILYIAMMPSITYFLLLNRRRDSFVAPAVALLNNNKADFDMIKVSCFFSVSALGRPSIHRRLIGVDWVELV